MKKQAIFAIAVSALLAMTGCGPAETHTSEENSSSVTETGQNVTKESSLPENDGDGSHESSSDEVRFQTYTQEISDELKNVKNYPNNYEELISLTDSYFRFFYNKNKSYTSESIVIDKIIDEKGNLLTLYYDSDKLVYVDFTTFGDLSTTYRKYYFINNEIVYITKCISDSNNDIGGNYTEYYIINDQWQSLSHQNKNIELSVDTNEKEIYDIVTDEINLNTKKFVEYGYTTIPNGLYSTYSEVRYNYFINNFINNKEKNSIVFFQIDNLELSDDFFPYNCIALFRDDQLMKFALLDSNNKCRIRYDYYVMDNDIGYVVVTNNEYSSESKYVEECVKTHYSEYFIIDEKLMNFDIANQDLVQLTNDEQILQYYYLAKQYISCSGKSH